MANRHVLVLIHGLITSPVPRDHQSMYQGFTDRLILSEPSLAGKLDKHIFVEWGHQAAGGTNLRADERLTSAESFLAKMVDYESLRHRFHPNNKLLSDWSLFFPIRGVLGTIRESLVLFGLGDAIYYCSSDGEFAVRRAVYGQVLDEIQPYENDNVYLHVVGHSLGTTVAYDLLYGLFAPLSNWGDLRPDLPTIRITVVHT